MSAIVVTPPATAEAVQCVIPSSGSLRVWTWVSTTPGSTQAPRASTVRAAGGRIAPALPIAAICSARTAMNPSSRIRSGRTTLPRTTRSYVPDMPLASP